MPCKVQPLLPSIGLELYQLGVHFLAKKKIKKKINEITYTLGTSLAYKRQLVFSALNLF